MIATRTLKDFLLINFIITIFWSCLYLFRENLMLEYYAPSFIMWFLFIINSFFVHTMSFYSLNKRLNKGNYRKYINPWYFVNIGILSTLIVLSLTLFWFVFINYLLLQENTSMSFWLESRLHTFQLIASVLFPITVLSLYFFAPLHTWILNNFKIYLIFFVSLFIIPLIICWYLDVHTVNLAFFWFIQFFESNSGMNSSCGIEIINRIDLMWLFALNPYQLFVCNYIFGFNTMMIVKKIISNESPELIKVYYGKN